MATTAQITGRILLPDNTPPVYGAILFKLSGFDTDSGDVVLPLFLIGLVMKKGH